MPLSQAFTYWSTIILCRFVVGIFLGYFCLKTQQTIIGPVAYHSSIIFIQSFVPYSLAFSYAEGHLYITLPVIGFIPLLFLINKSGRLGRS